MYTSGELERASMALDEPVNELENRIMSDIVRRIRANGEITSAADWQINRLVQLGMGMAEIQSAISEALGAAEDITDSLFTDVIRAGYVRDSKLYEAVGKVQIPFDDNEPLQQLISSVTAQTNETMHNITQSLGFAQRGSDGRISFTPLADYYQQTLDKAMLDISSGAFDYNTVLHRTVREMTNSGLRTVDYGAGWSNRTNVAARRAVMTGMTQLTAKVNEDNAEQLETDWFEISWHGGARPSHWWGGKWYRKDQLRSICKLGDVQGLCGVNCYHDYSPVIPGVSEPTYTDEELAELDRREKEPVEYNGKKYTKYEALQRQRRLETTMRAQRQEMALLKEGGADEDDLINCRARYMGTSHEYAVFSKAMGLPQQRERVTVDGLGNIMQGKYTKGSGKPSPVSVPKVGAKREGKVTAEERKELLSRNPVNVHNSSVDKSGESGKIETIEQAHEYLNSVFASVEKNVSSLDEQLVIDNTEQLRKLNERFGILTSENTGYISGSRIKATAETYSSLTENKYNLTLSFKYYKKSDVLLETEKRWQEEKYSMPVPDKNLNIATITHEYGHMIQYELIRKRIDPTVFEQYNLLRLTGNRNHAKNLIEMHEGKEAKNIFNEIIGIAKTQNPNIKLSEHLSKYGRKDYFEAFAEMFMNSQLGKPNELGKAMNIFLERSEYV